MKADTAALEAEIKAVEALKANDYTAETWVALSEALKVAKDVKNSYVQAEIDAALAALTAAKDALELVQNNNNGNTDGNNGGNSTEQPQDGCKSVLPVSAIALIATFGIATIFIRKKRED